MKSGFVQPLVSLGRSLGCAALLAALAACSNMKDQRGAKHVARDPAEGAGQRRAPEHTVARGTNGDVALRTGFDAQGQPVAHGPLPVTRELLAQGRERFNIFCAVCPGEDGYGQGIVVRRGFPPPPSYHDDRLRQAPDGYLYDVITRGHGVMLPFADRLTVDERWAVVAYLRALQRSQHVALRDLPAEDRARFNTP
jgi:hypothetical protein